MEQSRTWICSAADWSIEVLMDGYVVFVNSLGMRGTKPVSARPLDFRDWNYQWDLAWRLTNFFHLTPQISFYAELLLLGAKKHTSIAIRQVGKESFTGTGVFTKIYNIALYN